jgi:hypothetical protein
MLAQIWRAFVGRSTMRGMAKSERSAPIPRNPDLDQWVGLWVAVKDGKVIASAHNSRELVPALRALGDAGRGAVAQYIPQPSDAITIGVG